MDWKTIDAAIESSSLLKHPFYQAWSKGALTVEDLRHYAGQYYALESLFPRLLSRVHSAIEEPAARQAVLENLIEEERGAENHRELWLRFAEGLGLSRDEVLSAERHPKTREAVAELQALAADPDPAVGLAALYAYESQLPAVSASKIDGLKRFYGIDDSRAIRFFEVHEKMDAWHSAEERRLVDQLGGPSEKTLAAAERAAKALCTFLDGVEAERLARGGVCAC
jgi:pyrroloquinoline-quinone synthase